MRYSTCYTVEFNGKVIASLKCDGEIDSLLTTLYLKYGRERVKRWIEEGKLRLKPMKNGMLAN